MKTSSPIKKIPMLLRSGKIGFFHAKGKPKEQSSHVAAHLDQGINSVLPYLNAIPGGFHFIKPPPSVSFKLHGKFFAIRGGEICSKALRDEAEGEKTSGSKPVRREWPPRESMRGQLKP